MTKANLALVAEVALAELLLTEDPVTHKNFSQRVCLQEEACSEEAEGLSPTVGDLHPKCLSTPPHNINVCTAEIWMYACFHNYSWS